MGTVDKTSKMKAIEQELHGVEDELQHFEERQVNVTRTLQMIVYPAMVAFIILSAYGFYLVQSLTSDVNKLTDTIAGMYQSVDANMGKISTTMGTMNEQMTHLVASTHQMTNNIVDMNGSTQNMAGNIQQMNASTQNMAASTYNMQRDMWTMNKNISGSMKMFNKFSPFGSDTNAPYVVPPPVVTTSPYYHYYGWQQHTAVQPQIVPAPASTPTTAPMPAATMPAEVAPATPVSPPQDGAATAQDGHSAVTSETATLAIALPKIP